jgi:hypothetical protein
MPTSFARSVEDLLKELRQTIFAARNGNCFQRGEVNELYQKNDAPALNCERLSHIVSCAQCLDEINHMLKLAPLSERYPTDSIGKDTSTGGGGGAGGDDGGSVSGFNAVKASVKKYRRDAREAFEHHPSELCVSVNGYIQGSHKISSELSEFDLSANLAEEVGFVEVFSEQGIRLLLLNAEKPPPAGADTQTSRAKLSDGRSVELTLRYRSSWPTLHLVYRDPTFKTVEAIDVSALEQGSYPTQDSSLPSSEAKIQEGSLGENFLRLVTRLRRPQFNLFVFFRPAAVTAVLALLVMAIFLLVRLHRSTAPALLAANLLQQSVLTEEALAARTDLVLHRTISFEERRVVPAGSLQGELVASRKIEVWRSAQKGITARRLYDERGQLLAGDWRRADGVQTIYHHGVRPQLQLAPDKRSGKSAINFENVWQFDIGANEFSKVIGQTQLARVEERPGLYVVRYESDDGSGLTNLVNASLTLRRSDLHPTEQTFVIRQGSELREYRFTESVFERQPPSGIAPKVFEPDPELLPLTELGTRTSKRETTAVASLPSAPRAPLATADDEVEVLRLLNQAGVFLRDQVSVVRSPTDQLIVGGVVENDDRKRQIVSALAAVTKSRVARVEVETVAEVLQRQQARAASEPVTVQGVQVTETRIPVDAELRKYLSGKKGASGEQLDIEVRQFSERMLARSNQARLHALALKPVIERFSQEELQALSPEARSKWRSIVIEQVHSFASETAALHRELQPLFPLLSGTAESVSEFDVANDADLVRAVKRLMELASANDETVRGSFSVSANAGKTAPVKTAQFWRSLASAESLAARIGKQ